MNATRRNILGVAAGGALCAFGGCEKLVSLLSEELGQSVPDSVTPPDGAEIDPTHHLLNRAAYGPWPGDIQRVREMGAERWIDAQLDPDSIGDSACDVRARRAEFEGPPGECYEYKKPVLREEEVRHTLLRGLYSQRQLYEVMVGFWTDHLNINIDKGDCIYLKPWDDHNVVRKHALGKFRDLIRASATSPAMLVYLDGNQNKRAKPTDIPNENYAREFLELHTLGVHGGYTQHDVYEAARALTGWRVRKGFRKGTVYFESSEHDHTAKNLLGHDIPAGQNEQDVEDVIDIVARHPSTAMHIATKLVRRFVAEDPPAGLVKRAADVFQCTDGDIKQVVRVVLTSDEFKASRGTKFKPPLRFVISALRAVAADTHAHHGLIEYLSRMGQGIFQYPTPDGYPDKTSPWLGTLLWRWNFAFALANNQVPSVDVPVEKLISAIGATGEKAAMRIFEHCTGHAPTSVQSDALAEALENNKNGPAEVKELMGLVIASPAFQRY